LAIVRLWARIGYKPPRDIVLAFFADEEAGSIYGSRWIAKKRPELFAGCTEAISEVGGFSYTLDNGKRIYAVQSAEKGINWMKLTATGNAGHGSMINEKNAVTALTEAVTKIGRHKWPIRPTKTVKILFKKVAELTNMEYDENDLGKLLPKFGSMGSMIGATLQNIANPTMLEAGYKANVIPQSASAIIDGRFLPGYENELAETIKELVGPDIKVEVLTRDIALEVDFSGPLVDAMCAALKIEDPEGIPVPYLMSGGTDNKALSDLGIVGFGFSPIRFPADLEFMPLFHGINERVPVDGLKFGVRTLHHFLINC
jgi:acetylornithine deacetylase/succinyl-diaminopimelate desuccinylase-like protein